MMGFGGLVGYENWVYRYTPINGMMHFNMPPCHGSLMDCSWVYAIDCHNITCKVVPQ